jgi:hypothetical protein
MDEFLKKISEKAASQWFDNFRWVEFASFVGAAMAAGIQLGTALLLPVEKARIVGYFGSAFAAICFVRNPKMANWATKSSPKPASEGG